MKPIIGAAALTAALSATLLSAAALTGTTAFAADKTIRLDVQGMTCASCPYMVSRSLRKVDGVKAVDVSLQSKLAIVTFDDAKTTIAAMTRATRDAGFPSTLKTADMSAGMNVPTSAAAPMTAGAAGAGATAKSRGSH